MIWRMLGLELPANVSRLDPALKGDLASL